MGGGCRYKKKYIQFNFIQYISKGLKAASSDRDLGEKRKQRSKEEKKRRREEGKKQRSEEDTLLTFKFQFQSMH